MSKGTKKIIAIILEIIPIASFVLFFASSRIRVSQISILLAILGFVFGFAGRKLAKEDRMVRIIGVLDWLVTIFAGGLFALLIFASIFAGS